MPYHGIAVCSLFWILCHRFTFLPRAGCQFAFSRYRLCLRNGSQPGGPSAEHHACAPRASHAHTLPPLPPSLQFPARGSDARPRYAVERHEPLPNRRALRAAVSVAYPLWFVGSATPDLPAPPTLLPLVQKVAVGTCLWTLPYSPITQFLYRFTTTFAVWFQFVTLDFSSSLLTSCRSSCWLIAGLWLTVPAQQFRRWTAQKEERRTLPRSARCRRRRRLITLRFCERPYPFLPRRGRAPALPLPRTVYCLPPAPLYVIMPVFYPACY